MTARYHREIGNRIGEARQLGNLGNVYIQQLSIESAETHYLEALELHREAGNRLGEAIQLGNLGIVAAGTGHRERACRLLNDATAIYQEIGTVGEGPENVRSVLDELGCT